MIRLLNIIGARPQIIKAAAISRAVMLSEMIDVTAFLTCFIEEYPGSVEETKQGGKEFWEKFR